VQFFPGLRLLFSLNAAERKKGRTDLIKAVVLEIVTLSCDEAYARFSRETQACDLKSRCAKWGSKTVQCLVLDPNSIGVAHDIQHLSVGNQGVLRQIDDTNKIARFCRSSQLGTTETVQLSTGESVRCIYAEISGRATATSPAAAAHAATLQAAAAVPAAAAAVAAVTSTCLQSYPNFSSMSNASDQAKRKWLAEHCSPRPEALLLLLRKATVLFDTELPKIKRSLNQYSDKVQQNTELREAIKALGQDKTEPLKAAIRHSLSIFGIGRSKQAGETVATNVDKIFKQRCIEVHPDKHALFCTQHNIIDDEGSLRPMLQTAFKALQDAKELVQCWLTMGGEKYVPLEADVQTAAAAASCASATAPAPAASAAAATSASPTGAASAAAAGASAAQRRLRGTALIAVQIWMY
jgi:hypothetical protein